MAFGASICRTAMCHQETSFSTLFYVVIKKSNVCSIFDDFYRKYVNLCPFCSLVIRIEQGKGDKAGNEPCILDQMFCFIDVIFELFSTNSMRK